MPTFYDDINGLDDYLVTIKNSKTGEMLQGLLDNDEVSYTAAANIGGSTLVWVRDSHEEQVKL